MLPMRSKQPVDPVLLSYRRAMSAAVVTHARYLAALDETNVTQHLIDRRRDEWSRTETRREKLRAQLAPKPKSEVTS